MTPEWRRRLITALVFVCAVVAAFFIGKLTGPVRVERHESIEYRERQVIDWRTLKVEDITAGYTFARTVDRVVYRNVVTTITVTPDAGTTTTITDKTIEREGSQENHAAETKSSRREESTGRSDTESTGRTERSEVTTSRPSWSVGALVGATWKEPALTIAGPLVLGGVIEGRLGDSPVTLGVWCLTVGACGGIVRGEFDLGLKK